MAWYQNPADHLRIAGVTGTNGKSTTSWLLQSILQAAGHQTGLMGTIHHHTGVATVPSMMTTPDVQQQAELFAEMRRLGTDHCVMEISSHALDQDRCSEVTLAAAAITNITQDHFDYHGTFEEYRRAKLKISDLLPDHLPLLLCSDDGECRKAAEELTVNRNILTYGLNAEAELQAVIESTDAFGATMRLRLQNSTIPVRSHLIGQHNVQNCLAAAGMAEQLQVSAAAIVQGLENVRIVPGRLQMIDEGQPYHVYVDYAHTPDGIRHCLQTVRKVTTGRLICVFGAGGDRDRKKRPLMAQAAEEADVIVVTSDNPRSEHPERIIDEIIEGFSPQSRSRVIRCGDRMEAFRIALTTAHPQDSVVIMGRGHETLQQIKDRDIMFDDGIVVRSLLRQLRQHVAPSVFPAAGHPE
jgi:UDP-N-acetylmuramoyl-L-alanyl-D-glutamate--2,6-diaminopimelate ligase